MRVITAPEHLAIKANEVGCFLAGGIVGCYNWQKEVIDNLTKMEKEGLDLSDLVLFNPRRDNFPIDNKEATEEQIKWEFNALNIWTTIFSMYFCCGESLQPICMYELGYNLAQRFSLYRTPNEYFLNTVIVDVEKGYKREQDVAIQTKLITRCNDIVCLSSTTTIHSNRIVQSYKYCKDLYHKWDKAIEEDSEYS